MMATKNQTSRERRPHLAMLFEACPKCLNGDLELDCRQANEVMATCLQCGYVGRLLRTYPSPSHGHAPKAGTVLRSVAGTRQSSDDR
jgi:hypothetical protein